MSLTVPLKKALAPKWIRIFWRNLIWLVVMLALVLKLILALELKPITTHYLTQNQTQLILKGKRQTYIAQIPESALLLQRHCLTLGYIGLESDGLLYIATPQKIKTQMLFGSIVSGTVGNTLKYD